MTVNCRGITRPSGCLQLLEVVNPDSGVTFSEAQRGGRLGLPQVSLLLLEGSSARLRGGDFQDAHQSCVIRFTASLGK